MKLVRGVKLKDKISRLYKTPIAFPVVMIVLYIVLAIAGLYIATNMGLTPTQADNWVSIGMNAIVGLLCAYALYKLFGTRFLIKSNFIEKEDENLRFWKSTIKLVCAFILTIISIQIIPIGYSALTSNTQPIFFGQIELTPFYIILTIIVAPIAEELIFRGILFGRLAATKMPVLVAALISALIFAWLHGDIPSKFLATLTLGLFLCVLYEKTGNLALCMCAHALNNIIVIFLSGQVIPDFLLNGTFDIVFWCVVILLLVWLLINSSKDNIFEKSNID